jgi:hypothetical protein
MDGASKSSRPESSRTGSVITSGIILSVEIVFLNNFLEVAENLGEDEVLFCPMGRWLESMVEEGIVEYGLFVWLGYYKFLYDEKMDELFFYVLNPGLIVSSWEEIFEEVRRNERYLNKEILADVELIRVLESYDLFVYKKLELGDEERGFIKSMIQGEAEKELVRKEVGKRERYLEAIRGTYKKTLPKLSLKVGIGRDVKEKGVGGLIDYIKEGKAYVESLVEGRRILSIFQVGTGVVEVETDFVVDYDMSKVYIAFGKLLRGEKPYLLGVPLFKGKLSKPSSAFRSFGRKYKFVEIRKREGSKAGRDRFFAELRSDNVDLTVLYSKGSRVIEEKGNRRIIEVDHSYSKEIYISAHEGKEYRETGYTLCGIEIEKDGRFSIRKDYRNKLDVAIRDTWGELLEADELKEIIEKRKVGRVGRILIEDSDYSNRKLVLEESDSLGEVEEYIASRLYEFAKKLIRDKNGHWFQLDPSKGGDSEKNLVDIIQTGFIQHVVDRTLESIEKIVDLCYESYGNKYFVRSHNIEDPEKMAQEVALRITGISGDGLKGEEKRIIDVLKLISHSYPIMDHPNMEKVLEELKTMVGAIFYSERAPLDEIRVSIKRLVPEFLAMPAGRAKNSSSALILLEGDSLKVYAKSYRKEADYPNVKEVEIGLGNIEIRICKVC